MKTLAGLAPRAPSAHALGAVQLVAWGATFYAIPPLLPGISRGLDVSTSSLSVAMTIGLFFNAFASLAVGAWIHRVGARLPMLAGSVTASLALLMLASSLNGAMASIAIALLGAAHAALLYEPAFAAVSTMTRDCISRTRAVQVITFWGGWAALWAIPSATVLGAWLGWRLALGVFAGLLAALTIRVHTRLPPKLARSADSPRQRGPAISRALAAAFALSAFAAMSIVVNGLILLTGRDVSLAAGSIVFALLAPTQVLGRFVFMRRQGRLARYDGAIPCLLIAAGVAALLEAPHIIALAAFVVLFGAGAGLLTTMRAALIVARVEPEHVAKQLGVYSFISNMARAIAPALSTWLYVRAGYELSLLTIAALSLGAALLIWRATTAHHNGRRIATRCIGAGK